MKNELAKIVAAAAYVAMIAVNYLANALPIGGRTTGAVSNAYPNLFAPAALTFAIWGVIYLLLAGYAAFGFTKEGKNKEELLRKINPLFIATSLLNIVWIIAWHYDYIGVSVVIMTALLILLIKIADILRGEKFTAKENWLIAAPFSVYFGWITVATIANVTVFLVSIGWNGFGVADAVWTSMILFIGAGIGIWRFRKDRNSAYLLVLIWAYLGILFKHLSAGGFDGQYPLVIASVVAALVLFAYFGVKTSYKR